MSTRALLASPLGFLVGVSLGALGGGGSILAVPVLVFFAGQSPTQAISTSLVVVGVASVIGAHGHWRSGTVRVATGLVFGLVGIAGSLAGSALNRRLDGDVLLLGFAALVLVAAWRMVVGCPSCIRSGETRPVSERRPHGSITTRTGTRASNQAPKIIAAGTAVGFLTGLFGVGGGFVIVPALALVLEFPMREAVGTSLLVIAVNTGIAIIARLGTGTIDWSTTTVFTAAAVAGVVAGRRLADQVDPASLQRAFAALLVAVAVYTGTRSLLAIS
jgi:hypothetical protein